MEKNSNTENDSRRLIPREMTKEGEWYDYRTTMPVEGEEVLVLRVIWIKAIDHYIAFPIQQTFRKKNKAISTDDRGDITVYSAWKYIDDYPEKFFKKAKTEIAHLLKTRKK